MKRAWIRTGAFVITGIAALVAAPQASAQVVHSVHLAGGGFFPRGEEARVAGDVLVENLNSLAFRIQDFRGGQVNGEWAMTFGDRVEVAAGAGYYARRTDSVYADFVNVDGREIAQSLRLSVVPISGVVRFLPFGSATSVQPYVGAGVTAMRYRYSESGEFVDFDDNGNIFRHRYVGTGTGVGGVILAGLRMPIGGDVYGLSTELRYQFGAADLDRSVGFLSDRLDLSGLNLNIGFLIRF